MDGAERIPQPWQQISKVNTEGMPVAGRISTGAEQQAQSRSEGRAIREDR